MSPEKGGVLRTGSTTGKRVALAAVLGTVLLAAPFLLLKSGSASAGRLAAPASAGAPRSSATAGPVTGAPLPGLQLARFRDTPALPPEPVATATTTTAPPPPTTSTTAAPRPAVVVTVPSTTTTTTTTTTTVPPPPPTTTTTAPPASSQSAQGLATWYSEAGPGTCASPWLPRGTVLTVTDDATGVTITCLVDDREADNPGRVVDLSEEGFSALAPLSSGVIEVTVSW
jgi:hypothetical protein